MKAKCNTLRTGSTKQKMKTLCSLIKKKKKARTHELTHLKITYQSSFKKLF